MTDYIDKLKSDLIEQFRGKPNIEAMVEVIGRELEQVFQFYEQLRDERGVNTAIGKQLDGVGNIVDMTRMQAGELAGNPIPYDILDDDTYRQYLIYKILKNTTDCTYYDIVKAFRMFWDRPLYYSEDPAQPATMIFDTGEMQGFVDTRPLFKTPLIRAAGVTLKLYARTSTPIKSPKLNVFSGLGYAVTSSTLPTIERDYDYRNTILIGSGYHTEMESGMPPVERDYQFGFSLRLGANNQSITHDTIPDLEKGSGIVYSVMETPINGMTLQE